LAAITGAVVMVSSGVIFSSAAFWLGPVDAAARQLFELVITFSVYPEPLLGGVLRVLLFTLVPAGFVGYVPARVVQAPTVGGAAGLGRGRTVGGAGGLVLVAGAYAGGGGWVLGGGLRKYCGGSRFEVVG